jgi:hypothetical protein
VCEGYTSIQKFKQQLATHCFPIMWNKNTFFHKNNTLTTEIQQLALSNWLSYWPIIFNQDMNIPKFNSMSFLACSLRAMTVLTGQAAEFQ